MATATFSPFNPSIAYEYEIAANISAAIVQIIQHEFIKINRSSGFLFKMRSSGFVWNGKTETKQGYPLLFDEIIRQTLGSLKDSIGYTMAMDQPIALGRDIHFGILMVDSRESLEFLFKNILKYRIQIKCTYVIVLHAQPNPSHYYDELYGILQFTWLAGMPHANVLLHAVHNEILLFHQRPFTQFHCNYVAPIVANQFIDGQWQHMNFYASKSKNLHGCRLRCASWEDMPFIAMRNQKLLGFEGKIINYLAQQMNFTADVYLMSYEEMNLSLYDENAGWEMLSSKGVNFTFSFFQFKESNLADKYAATSSYYLSIYYFVMLKNLKPYGSVERLLLPFNWHIWCLLLLTYISGFGIIFLVSHLRRFWRSLILGRHNAAPYCNILNINIGGSVPRDPQVPMARFLLMAWLLASFVLRIAYLGSLYRFIKQDLDKPLPSTIAELRRMGTTPYMTDLVRQEIQSIPWLYNNARTINGTEVQNFNALATTLASQQGTSALLTAYEYFGYFMLHGKPKYDFYIVQEPLFFQLCRIFAPKNSPLFKRLDLYLSYFINTGLMDYWDNFYIKNERLLKNLPDDEIEAMTFAELSSAFGLLAGGLTLSLAVFLGELAICYIKNRRCKARQPKKGVVKIRAYIE